MKVGIFGGTFDPVHSEHIKIARAAIEEFSLDKLIVCPALNPPHKVGCEFSPFENRFEMLKIAFSSDEKVEVSDYEKTVSGASYTFLTIDHFSAIYENAELFFLVGTDMMKDFPTWKNPDKILSRAKLIVTPREGDDFSSAFNVFFERFKLQPLVASAVGKNTSSTKARIYKKLGIDTIGILPPEVSRYIDKNSLYVGDENFAYVRKMLPERRLKHTANVVVKALELAKRLGADRKKTETAALLHDIAKYMKPSHFPAFRIPNDVPQPVPDQVLHQFLGAYVAENVLGVSDEEILNAIRFHTTGRKNMGLIERIVFIADLIEEDRRFDGVDEIRRRVDENFDDGFSFAMSELAKFLGEGNDVYPLTRECAEFYQKAEQEE